MLSIIKYSVNLVLAYEVHRLQDRQFFLNFKNVGLIENDSHLVITQVINAIQNLHRCGEIFTCGLCQLICLGDNLFGVHF